MTYQDQNQKQNYRNSIYSFYSLSLEENHVEIDEILNFYTNDTNYNNISESMPLPISDENMIKLKNQWNKNTEFKIKEKKEKNIWGNLTSSIKLKINSLPKRSFYDVLTK